MRQPIVVAALVVALVVAGVFTAGSVVAPAPESLELLSADIAPNYVAPDSRSLVHVKAYVGGVPVRRVLLQGPGRLGRWKSVARLRDDGLKGDASADDGVFSADLWYKFPASGSVDFRVLARTPHDRVRLTSLPTPVFVADAAAGVLNLAGDTNLSYPPTWEPRKTEGGFQLSSPGTVEAVQDVSPETPQDLTVSIEPKSTDVSLATFVSSYQDGWFANYSSSELLVLSGRSAVHLTDAQRAPVDAYFVEVSPVRIVVLTIGDYERPGLEDLRDEAERILESLNQ